MAGPRPRGAVGGGPAGAPPGAAGPPSPGRRREPDAEGSVAVCFPRLRLASGLGPEALAGGSGLQRPSHPARSRPLPGPWFWK